MIDITKPVRTRNGSRVTGLRDRRQENHAGKLLYPLVGRMDGADHDSTWTPEGRLMTLYTTPYDLFNVEEPVMKPVDFTKPVQTRDGRPVTLLTTQGRGTYPVMGYVGDDVTVTTWRADGCVIREGSTNPVDLVNVPQKGEVWFNVYEDGSVTHHRRRARADNECRGTRIARVKVTYEEGQFDE